MLLFLLACSAGELRADTPDKPEVWTEVRSPNFVVVSNGGEKEARRVAAQFEQFRVVFRQAFPGTRVDPGKPFLILAAKNEKTLRILLPGFWQRKGQMNPAGMFVPGDEKLFVALRTDFRADVPFKVIYHEYVHALVRLNFEGLPLWLNEGLAEFFSETMITDDVVHLGKINAAHITLLRGQKLLPLDVLFAVDPTSPEYNEEKTASILYAQSWAIVHYLRLGDAPGGNSRLTNYIALLKQQVNPVQAGVQAFGDLSTLEKQIGRYVQRRRFAALRMKSPAESNPKSFAARPLRAAEWAALLGDFYVHTDRRVEARAQLEQAIALDPASAQAQESMGVLLLNEEKYAEAGEYFGRAAQLDSRSYLTQYYAAALLMRGARDNQPMADDVLERAEGHLRRSIDLNPGFAPAVGLLASVLLRDPDRQEEAVTFARRATDLEPGELAHQLTLAGALLNLKRTGEAIAIANRLLQTGPSADDRELLQAFLLRARQVQESLARVEAAHKELEERQRQREQERRQAQPGDSAAPGHPAASTGAGGYPRGKRAQAEGKIMKVTCTEPAALDLVLDLAGYTLKLHTPNYLRLDFLSVNWVPPDNFQPCNHLKGLNARIVYDVLMGAPYAGEIVTVEIRQ